MKNGTIISFKSENLVTLKSIVPLFSGVTFPHPKYSIKLFIKSVSLALWVNIKLNLIASSNLDVLDLNSTTLKQPSAFTNPANQKGSIILVNFTSGLKTGIKSGKAAFRVSVKPLFKTAFKDTRLSNPSLVK